VHAPGAPARDPVAMVSTSQVPVAACAACTREGAHWEGREQSVYEPTLT
jgi:hypothetical protein